MGIEKPLPEESQQQLAEQSLLGLTKVANRLMTLAEGAFSPTISYYPMDGADMMALSFTTKQREHLASVLMLVDGGAHRDACLIARSMLEGFAQLKWAFANIPERTDLWRLYGLIEDWRQFRRNEERGYPIEPEDKLAMKRLIREYGPRYYTGKAKRRIAEATRDGVDASLPDDPYRRAWTDVDVRSMMRDSGNLVLYDIIYRHASAWIHWNPRSLYRAIDRVSPHEVSGFTEVDWVSAAYAMLAACRSIEQTLEVLDDHFSLGLSETLQQLSAQLEQALQMPR